MKQQLLFLIFAFFIGLTSSQSQNSLTHKIIEFYDSDEDTFTEFSRQEYTYLTNGQLKSATNYSNLTGASNIGSRELYTYDGNGNVTETLYSSWNESLNEWNNREKNVTTYTNNRMTRTVDYDWENGQWTEDDKTDFGYVGANIDTFNSYEWDDGQWINDFRGNLSYNSNKLKEFISEEFENGAWTLNEKNIYIRNATTGKIEDIISQIWNETDWENDSKISYALDTNGNRKAENYFEWDDDSTWKLDGKVEYTYDTTALMSDYNRPFFFFFFANFLFSEIGLVDTPHHNKVLTNLLSGYEDSEWEPGLKTTYYYSDDTMSLNDLSDNNFITVYPNPVKSTLNISLDKYTEAGVSLYDLNGRLILEKRLQALNTRLNIETLNSGMYVLKIHTEDGFATKRITKQ